MYNLHQWLKFLSFDVSGNIIYGSYELTSTGLLLINDMSSNYWASRNGKKHIAFSTTSWLLELYVRYVIDIRAINTFMNMSPERYFMCLNMIYLWLMFI
jgi:hypothetical protein